MFYISNIIFITIFFENNLFSEKRLRKTLSLFIKFIKSVEYNNSKIKGYKSN